MQTRRHALLSRWRSSDYIPFDYRAVQMKIIEIHG
jgi:hypothetical protein